MNKFHLGSVLIDLSRWIRRQPLIMALYRQFPLFLRSKVSEGLAARVSRQVKFQRTPNWERRASEPDIVQEAKGLPARSDEAVGVNVIAYARGQFGLGESARLYTRALLRGNHPVAVCDIAIDLPHGNNDTSLRQHIGVETPFGINLIFVNPDHLDEAIASIGRDRLANRYNIACWFWELEKFPEAWRPALSGIDEFMVASDFIGEALRRVTDKPILHVPLPVAAVHDSGLVRADFGLEDESFVFLNSFDFNSFLARKNPLAVIEAFRRAFADGRGDVRLLIKSSNGDRQPDKLRALLDAAAGDRRILIRDEIMDRSDLQALQRCVNAYVSLHRAEGFGLGLAECMRAGKPVIATAWSGNMEFMTSSNSCLVDYQLVPVGEGEYVHHAGQRWAEADVGQAAAHMLRLVEDCAFAASIGAQAASDIRVRLSPEVAAERIRHRLGVLSRNLATTGGGPGPAVGGTRVPAS